MSDEKLTVTPAESESDHTGRPFGYLEPGTETAMICEQDAALQDKISGELKKMGFATVEPSATRDALKYMRFHIFNIIVINEDFDTGGKTNEVLRHLEGLSMAIRRQTFVVLISGTLDTMDNMQTYNKSVNLIINKKEIDDAGQILKRALTEHNTFYHVYKECLRKHGKGQ